jgi:hypothetical protein
MFLFQRWFGLALLFCGVGGALFCRWSWADEKECTQLFRKGQAVEAGDCFLKEAEKIGSSAQLPNIQRFKKGRHLLNAARLFTRASQKEKDAQKEELIGRALQIFHQYLHESLYENDARKRAVENEKARLQSRSSFSLLRLFSYDSKARICVVNSRQEERCQVAFVWMLYLPAGSYEVKVVYPDAVPQKRRLTLSPNENFSHSFSASSVESLVEISTGSPQAEAILRGAALLEPMKHKGATWRIKLPPGPYTLRLAYPEGIPYERNFQVTPSEKLALRYAPPSSTLAISSVPLGAQIFLEGIYQGVTPMTLKVSDGSYRVHLLKQCHLVAERMVEVAPKKEATLSLLLETEAAYQGWQTQKKSEGLQRVLGLSALFVGLGLTGLGVAGQIVAQAYHDDAMQKRFAYQIARSDFEARVQEYNEAAQNGNAWRTFSYVGLGLGLVSLGFGIYLTTRPPLPPMDALPCEINRAQINKKKL